MKALVLATLLVPSALGQSLAFDGRCAWAERGWQREFEGLTSRDQSHRGFAEAAEHAREHGWASTDEDLEVALVRPTSACPVVALDDLERALDAADSHESLLDAVAKALARNGRDAGAERAIALAWPIDGVEARVAARSANQRTSKRAWLAKQRGDWNAAAELFDRCRSNARCGNCRAGDYAEWRAARAQCLFELARIDELELLVFNELERDCSAAHLIVRAWRAGLGSRDVESYVASFPGRKPSADDRLRARMQAAREHVDMLERASDDDLAWLAASDASHASEVLRVLRDRDARTLLAFFDRVVVLQFEPPNTAKHQTANLLQVLALTGHESVEPWLDEHSSDRFGVALPYSAECLKTWREVAELRARLTEGCAPSLAR